MKKLIIKLGLFGAMILASVQLSYAASVSSQPVNPAIGFVGSPFLIQPYESVSYIIASTGASVGAVMSTVAFQYSSNNQNWATEVTTAPLAVAGAWEVRGELPIKYQKTYYRFKLLGSSGNATVITLYDNDNEVMTIKNRKYVDALILNDESLELKGRIIPNIYNYKINTTSAAIALSTYTQMQWGRDVPYNKINTTHTIKIDASYVVLTTTAGVGVGNDLTLNARPIITTETANNGDFVMFESRTSSITFTSGTNTGLILGAATRVLDIDDIIQFVFRDGYWREVSYTDTLPNP